MNEVRNGDRLCGSLIAEASLDLRHGLSRLKLKQMVRPSVYKRSSSTWATSIYETPLPVQPVYIRSESQAMRLALKKATPRHTETSR